jgi:hypothetical protein
MDIYPPTDPAAPQQVPAISGVAVVLFKTSPRRAQA